MSAPVAHRLRAIPAELEPAAVADVDTRLAQIRRDHGITICFAIESGSRAWGFPSPDSDYDCRFVFVRAFNAYLSPWPLRDVIETPLDGLLDVNGWDLGKALKLLLKGNAVIVEWLMSPIVYDGDAQIVEDVRAFAERFASRNGIAQHYLHLGEKQRPPISPTARTSSSRSCSTRFAPPRRCAGCGCIPIEPSPPCTSPP